MRLIDVVLASVLIGLAIGFLHTAQPSAASPGVEGARETRNAFSERITWLRTPAVMRRTASIQ